MSASDSCVCRRMFKSRIVERMAFSAEGLTAGLWRRRYGPSRRPLERPVRSKREETLTPHGIALLPNDNRAGLIARFRHTAPVR